MPMTIQHTVGGAVLITSVAGAIAGECCCGTTTTTTPTISCGSTDCLSFGSPVQCPAVVLTVTAADGNLPVTWCGITWRPSTFSPLGDNDRYSGQSAQVCPGTYFLGTFIQPPPVFVSGLLERWRLTGELDMARRAYKTLYLGTERLTLFGSLVDQLSFPTGGGTNTLSSDLSLIIGDSRPTTGNYRLLASQYDNSFTAGGVTYAWEKGLDWP